MDLSSQLKRNYARIVLSPALKENTKIVVHLLKQCSKKEPTTAIHAKGTIDSYSRENFVFAFTDSSSDETLNNGGAGGNFTFPQDCNTKHFRVGVGKIASNYICELIAIQKALDEYISLKRK